MILVNGQAQKSVSVHDRGLHYGDGVFETIAVINGQPLCWEQHIERLVHGCNALGLDCPPQSSITEDVHKVCTKAPKNVLKIIITRGSASRGYQVASVSEPTRIVALYDWPEYPSEYQTQGIEAQICQNRLGHNVALAGIKHLNRLEQVLLRNELVSSNIPEGIVLDVNGYVVEGTMSNIFCLKGKELYTPDLAECGVAGIIRKIILQLSETLQLQNNICKLTIDDLYSADELFFCNSIIGIWPIVRIQANTFPSGNDTHRIRQKLIEAGLIFSA